MEQRSSLIAAGDTVSRTLKDMATFILKAFGRIANLQSRLKFQRLLTRKHTRPCILRLDTQSFALASTKRIYYYPTQTPWLRATRILRGCF